MFCYENIALSQNRADSLV